MFNDIKVIFFDMGNTLLHFHYGKSDEEKDDIGLRLLADYLKEFNEEITLNEIRSDFYNKWMEIMPLRKKLLIEFPIEDYLNGFLHKYNVKLNHSECIKAINLFYTEYKKQLYFENDIVQVLRCIKSEGYKIGVISNTCYYEEIIKDCFKIAKIDNLIDYYTFSYYLRIRKPNKEIFKVALGKANVCPRESIMVGDNIEADIKPALELGLKTVWFNKNNIENKTGIIPDIEITKISEICNYI